MNTERLTLDWCAYEAANHCRRIDPTWNRPVKIAVDASNWATVRDDTWTGPEFVIPLPWSVAMPFLNRTPDRASRLLQRYVQRAVKGGA